MLKFTPSGKHWTRSRPAAASRAAFRPSLTNSTLLPSQSTYWRSSVGSSARGVVFGKPAQTRTMSRWVLVDSDKYLKEHKSFSDRLKAMIDSHDRLNAEKWLEEMKSYGSRPSPVVYQELVRWFAEHDKLPELEKTMAEMVEKKIKPSQFMFDRMVHLYAKHKDKDGLKRTLKQMEEWDLEPNMDTFTEMISAYAKLGDEGDALRTYEHVRRVFGHANSVQTTEVILMLAQHHDWANLKEIWREFQQSHEKPSQLLLNTVFDIAYEKMKDMPLAKSTMELLVKYGYEIHPQKYDFLKNI